MGRVRQLAERTPPDRERVVDLLRGVSIILVLLGHWLIAVIGYDAQGRITGRSALPYLPWAWPVTWLVQVVPVFFLVGGYANAASLANHLTRGGDRTRWLVDRAARLVRPTTALLLTLAGAALVAWLAGARPAEIRPVVWLATIPLWFLVAYIIVVLLTPPMYALHRRFGFAVPVILIVLVAVGDTLRLHGHGMLAAGNLLFGWLAIHQAGFLWRDGRLPARARTAVPVLLAGLAVAVLLTGPGPYPVSMIDIPGQRLRNASPPTLALLATATFQLGLVLLIRNPARRWLRRPRVWTAVVAVNAVVLTIFLWHMTAVILLIGALDAAGRLPTPTVASTAWWLWRLPWLAMLMLLLTLLVAVFGRFEVRAAGRPVKQSQPDDVEQRRRRWLPVARSGTRWHAGHRWLLLAGPSRPGPRAALAVAGYTAVAGGLLANSLTPKEAPEPIGLPVAALTAYLTGAGLLRLLHAQRNPTGPLLRSPPDHPPR